MSEIRALEKLRECANHESAGFFVNLEQTFGLHRYKCGDSTVKPNGRMILNSIADAIESEIAERFMELPVDADGVPWTLETESFVDDTGREVVFSGLEVDYAGRWRIRSNCVLHDPSLCRHAKPDPLKELLSELANEVWEASCTCQTTWSDSGLDGIEERYAERIRELMKEGGE